MPNSASSSITLPMAPCSSAAEMASAASTSGLSMLSMPKSGRDAGTADIARRRATSAAL